MYLNYWLPSTKKETKKDKYVTHVTYTPKAKIVMTLIIIAQREVNIITIYED